MAEWRTLGMGCGGGVGGALVHDMRASWHHGAAHRGAHQCPGRRDCRRARATAHRVQALAKAPALADAMPVVGKKQRSSNRASDKSCIEETFEEIKWERTSTSPATLERTFPHDVQNPVARQGLRPLNALVRHVKGLTRALKGRSKAFKVLKNVPGGTYY